MEVLRRKLSREELLALKKELATEVQALHRKAVKSFFESLISVLPGEEDVPRYPSRAYVRRLISDVRKMLGG